VFGTQVRTLPLCHSLKYLGLPDCAMKLRR
jgi:hypothetical protein